METSENLDLLLGARIEWLGSLSRKVVGAGVALQACICCLFFMFLYLFLFILYATHLTIKQLWTAYNAIK